MAGVWVICIPNDFFCFHIRSVVFVGSFKKSSIKATHAGTDCNVRCLTSWKKNNKKTKQTNKQSFHERRHKSWLPQQGCRSYPYTHFVISLHFFPFLPHPLLFTLPRSHQHHPAYRPEKGAYATLSGTLIPATGIRRWLWWLIPPLPPL